MGIFVIVLFVFFYLFTVYNGLVGSSESIDSAWAQVETQYQRRFDLIPNIVRTVQGFASHETEVFANIAEARTRYSGAGTINDKVRAVNQVESALGRLLVITENYPDLKSSKNFTELTVELEGTENRISVERMRFNETVKVYNLLTKRFPSSIVASYFSFEERNYFGSDAEAEKAPEVNF